MSAYSAPAGCVPVLTARPDDPRAYLLIMVGEQQ